MVPGTMNLNLLRLYFFKLDNRIDKLGGSSSGIQ